MSDKAPSVSCENPPATGEETRPGCLPQRLPFTKPKLRFVEPLLTHRGDLSRVTQQQGSLFGDFNPDNPDNP